MVGGCVLNIYDPAPTPSLCDRGEGTSETGSKGRSYGEGGEGIEE